MAAVWAYGRFMCYAANFMKSLAKNFQHTSEPAFEAGRVVRGYGAVRCGTGADSNLPGVKAASYKIIENTWKVSYKPIQLSC